MNRKAAFAIVIMLFFCLLGCSAQEAVQAEGLQLVATIELPNVNGRIDHLAYDPKGQKVFVAALGNNTVEVVDLQSKKLIHTIEHLNEPQGILYTTENNSIWVANGGNGECAVFNAATYQKTNSIILGGDADNIRYDSLDEKVYVGYGNDGIAIIDAKTIELLTQIKLSGHPESFQLDAQAKRIYVNVPGQKQIEIIDLEKNMVTDSWAMKAATSNFPMCLDGPNHRLFIGCRYAPKLLIIDTQTGQLSASYDIDGDIDDIFYEDSGKQIFLSCGEGYLDVFKEKTANTFILNGKTATQKGARTSLLIPEIHQLLVAAPAGLNREASLLVFQLE